MHPVLSATDTLLTVAEPTRLRILNCLAAAPLFVSDLQAVLDLPQPTVSRHLQVLRRAELVRDTPVAQFVLAHPTFPTIVHEAGIPVHTWTVDDEATMEQLLYLGVDAVFTNTLSLVATVTTIDDVLAAWN